MEFFWNFFGIFLEIFWNFFGIFLEFFWNFLEIIYIFKELTFEELVNDIALRPVVGDCDVQYYIKLRFSEKTTVI